MKASNMSKFRVQEAYSTLRLWRSTQESPKERSKLSLKEVKTEVYHLLASQANFWINHFAGVAELLLDRADFCIARVADLLTSQANLWISRFTGVMDLLAGRADFYVAEVAGLLIIQEYLWIPHFNGAAGLLVNRADFHVIRVADLLHRWVNL